MLHARYAEEKSELPTGHKSRTLCPFLYLTQLALKSMQPNIYSPRFDVRRQRLNRQGKWLKGKIVLVRLILLPLLFARAALRKNPREIATVYVSRFQLPRYVAQICHGPGREALQLQLWRRCSLTSLSVFQIDHGANGRYEQTWSSRRECAQAR